MNCKMYYVMDLICVWCYGFESVISKIMMKYKDIINIEIVQGGIWIGDCVETMTEDNYKYIEEQIIKIQNTTDKVFGEKYIKNILENRNTILDSMLGSKAILAVSDIDYTKVNKFINEMQEKIYIQGKNANDLQVYIETVKELEINKDKFEELLKSSEIEERAFKNFELAQKLGIEIFPSIFLEKDKKIINISKGYVTFEELDNIIKNQINSIKYQ